MADAEGFTVYACIHISTVFRCCCARMEHREDDASLEFPGLLS